MSASPDLPVASSAASGIADEEVEEDIDGFSLRVRLPSPYILDYALFLFSSFADPFTALSSLREISPLLHGPSPPTSPAAASPPSSRPAPPSFGSLTALNRTSSTSILQARLHRPPARLPRPRPRRVPHTDPHVRSRRTLRVRCGRICGVACSELIKRTEGMGGYWAGELLGTRSGR